MVRKKKTHIDHIDESDIVPEEDADQNSASDALDKVRKLKKELEACRREKQEYLDGWQRLRADVANAKKQQELAGESVRENTRRELFEDILPVLDSFEMAFSGSAWVSVDEGWRKGVEHIFSQLQNVLGQYGIASFGAVDEDFDPHRHEAIESIETTDTKLDGMVADVARKGYISNGVILRPAQVKIFKYKN